MRKWILAGLAVAVVLGCVIYLESGESAKEQADKQMAQFQAEMHAASSSIQADIDESKARLITIKLGEVAGLEFKRCKISPPKLEENRAKCKGFEEYLKKLDAEEKAHPSW
jgi:hypothetical protein